VSVTLHLGDCREVMPAHSPFDMIVADPPYGDTSLEWDRRVEGWHGVARAQISHTGSMWVFGSLRYFLAEHRKFEDAGWRVAQEIVWEKHNGSSFHADRFKRVHEFAVHYYPADAAWGDIYNSVQTTADATPRTVRRKGRPAHTGNIGQSSYTSEDGGPRIMRSVIPMRSCHGSAIHPTEKPVGLLEILIRTSCPAGGVVGDFFAGSGAAGEAASHCGRSYIGCEIDPGYHAAASDRLAQSLFSGRAA
jgi:site-specific DNA-methyltransferase (adenine-specific)